MAAVRTLSALLVLALFAVQAPAEDVQSNVEDDLIQPSMVFDVVQPATAHVRQARQQTTTTVTLIKTVTSSTFTTTTITTKKTCGVLASISGVVNGAAASETASPAAACRRRRHLMNKEHVFVAWADDSYKSDAQFIQLSPAQVYNFNPTMVPQFRSNAKIPGIELVNESTDLEGSFEKGQQNLRLASPIFATAISNAVSSIVSSIVSNFLVVTTTTTSTSTAYLSIVTSTSYSATVSYYIGGTCYPSGATLC